ncbi:MAG: AAA family ATPase, partial [Thermoflexales bacterium]|nr:AAA family ATPase [Thermoflexales bacterium]
MKSPKTTSETKIAPAANLDRQHLQAHLARLDVRLHRAVRHWQLAGQDSTDAFRGLKVTDAEASALLDRPLAANWGTIGQLPPDEAAVLNAAEQHAERDLQQITATAKQIGATLRLNQLATAFNLDRFDIDVLLICLAPALDLRYEKLYGYLQDDVTRQHPSLNLMLDLLTEPGLSRLQHLSHFENHAPLMRHQLIELVTDAQPHPSTSQLGQAYRIDRAIAAWLLGQYRPQVELGQQAQLNATSPTPLDELLAAPVRVDLERAAQTRSIVVLHGIDAASQQAAARVLAHQSQRPLLSVDLAGIVSETTSALAAVRLALRDARLTGALPCLTGWDVCLSDGAPAPEVLAEVCAFDEVAVIAGRRAWQPRGVDRTRALLWLEFPIPDYAQRLALWQHFLQASAPAGFGNPPEANFDLDFTLLAGQFMLTARQIRDAVASARDAATQRDAVLAPADLFAAARAHSSPVLGSLAHKISPRYSWSDIVLPTDQLSMLHEIIDTVRGRPIVLETWGVGEKLASSSGVTVLFSGPPGTGKTMAAEVIAAELELDLY